MNRRSSSVSHEVTDVWKAMETAELLLPNYIVRVESCSKEFSATAAAN